MSSQDQQNTNQHPLANYQFSSDELRVFRECNIESFYQRSLPLGTALGLGAYFGCKQGYLTPSMKYGSIPKVLVGAVVGYFIGKFSYQQKCAEKLMALPNSRLAEILRQRKNQQSGAFSALNPDQGLGVGMALGPFAPSPTDIYTDDNLQPQSMGNALNLDVESRPSFAGLDDIYRPNLDSAVTTQVDPDIPLEPVKPGMTYDELRKRNREEYMKRQQSPYAQPLPSNSPVLKRTYPPPQQQTPSGQQEDTHSKQMQKNKYGDTWQE